VNRKKILIAIDGSPAADAAVDAGLELAMELGAPVRFVHASSPLAEHLFELEPEEGPSEKQILATDGILAEASRRAADRGVASEVELIANGRPAGDLAATIAGIAAGIDAGMIVVGSRGLGTVAGTVLGSVSQNLIRYAAQPVLVVHAPAA